MFPWDSIYCLKQLASWLCLWDTVEKEVCNSWANDVSNKSWDLCKYSQLFTWLKLDVYGHQIMLSLIKCILHCIQTGIIPRVGSTWNFKKQILCSKWAHFKKAWHILKALSCPCPLGSKLIRFGGFQKGAVCPCSLRGCKVVLCQSLRMSIHSIKNNDSNFDVH